MRVLDTYSHIGFTCFPRSLEEIRCAVRRVLQSPPPIQFTEREVKLQLAEIYTDAPLPGGAHPAKVMLFSPSIALESTVFFANYVDGWQTLVICISKLISCRIYDFALGSESDKWPLYRFEVLEGGVQARHISVIKDVDRWKFYETGEPLPEEDATMYRKRRIKDRLPRSYLVELASRLGFEVGDDRFWESAAQQAVYFEDQSPNGGNIQT